ncbi:MAG: diaminopimelate epimerase [Gemmatimonadetes bacterium]|nr:diaminopimelate epimerase [Gemmatimonadota bacterium]
MEQPLFLGSRFFKGHGHGNDYLVFEEGDSWLVTRESVQTVCHRTRGVGGDGIVALLNPPLSHGQAAGYGPSMKAEAFRLRMFNPDGSEFERSGNGLRILGAFLYSQRRVTRGSGFPVEVGGETVQIEILAEEPGGTLNVAVDMGFARIGMGAVGGTEGRIGPEGPTGVTSEVDGPEGRLLTVIPVSVGNPHCVVFRAELRESDLRELGPFLTNHPVFPAGVNVQLAEVRGPGEVEILIWERGVGRTASSGSSACAVAAGGVAAGLLEPGGISVKMEGGSFLVTVSEELDVRLEGPVQPLCAGTLDDSLLLGLEAIKS